MAYMQPYQSSEEKREGGREGGRVCTATFFFYFFLCYSLISERLKLLLTSQGLDFTLIPICLIAF